MLNLLLPECPPVRIQTQTEHPNQAFEEHSKRRTSKRSIQKEHSKGAFKPNVQTEHSKSRPGPSANQNSTTEKRFAGDLRLRSSNIMKRFDQTLAYLSGSTSKHRALIKVLNFEIGNSSSDGLISVRCWDGRFRLSVRCQMEFLELIQNSSRFLNSGWVSLNTRNPKV